MTDSVSRIQIIAPERLNAFITHYNDPVERQRFALAFMRLLVLQTNLIGEATPQVHRVSTILPCHRSLAEIDWTCMENPDVFGNRGKHVMNGGLVRHAHNGEWGIHT
jgi:hypothetical protein